jgi:hypothetical protein
MIQKLKKLFKKKSSIKENTIVSTEDWKFINNPFHEEIPKSLKIASQKIGLDLVKAEPFTGEMTIGYFDFKIVEQEKSIYEQAEETLFQMKKVKRASEKVLEKMIHTEKQLEDSIRYYEHKHEHSKSHR